MNSASENDLQKAIDDIARANKTDGASTVDSVAQGVAATSVVPAIDTAPAPETAYIETNGQVPAAAAPVVAPAADTVAAAPAETPAESAPVPVETPADAADAVGAAVAEATEGTDESEEPKTDYGGMEADAVRERAIDELKPMIGTVDLAPMLSKMEMLPETKFKIFKNIIEATSDKEVLGLAYATAKEITNDTDRAEALLYIVEMVDKLT